VEKGVYMLIGQGGNIGLCVGEDGAFVVDDQFAPLTEKIQGAIAKVTDQSVRFLVNTHWHGDHTGGNENFGKMGVVIVAHENVRRRMSVEQFMEAFGRSVPPSPPKALPIITFTDGVVFHLNGDEVRVFHVEHAHTDGDAVVYWMNANVVHTGDVYFNGTYPFIDISSGGSLEGTIEGANRVLELANDQTKIVPGHGALSNRAELVAYRDMLVTARNAIRNLLDQGKTIDEVVAAKPTKDLDAKWGQGFMKPDVWVKIVASSMQHQQ